ncbi:MAG: glycoside hydrolase family 31 protein [Bacilli bacterium]|nr:glycoside hydrolase family 31 protein [Bacilli bacterium]
MYKLGDQFVLDNEQTKSKEKAIFKGKTYRITILTERLVRLEYHPDGIFEDRPTELVYFRNFDVPNIGVRQDQNFLELTTRYFKLEYAKEKSFKSGVLNAGSNLKVTLLNTDRFWYYNHPEVRNYYGTNVSLDDTSDSVKLKKGLYSAEGFASIDDSNGYIIDEYGVVTPRDSKGMDIYLFMYRKDFNLCLKDYFDLTGKPPLIPRYALGNWWSKEYRYSDLDIKALVNRFEKENIPIAVLMLDKDWHIRNTDDKKDLETGYSWNKQLFPAPYDTINFLHGKHIRVGIHVNPKDGIHPHEEMYSKAATYLENQEQKTIQFDPLNPRFLDVYFKLFIHPLEMLGIDFFWIDYEVKKKNLNILWVLNHYHFLDMERSGNKRGMLLSRNALVASHRYPIHYSGRTLVSWDTLKLLPYYNSSSSNIGVSWWSHDIGGSYGGIEDGELYTRSVQLGTFSPILRFHSIKGKYYKREPWMWGVQTLEIVNDYLKLRHSLIPYLYTEAYNYHKLGTPLVQPIYYKYPETYDDPVYKNQYYFGSGLLVAPIITKKDIVMDRVIHRFFLPEGIWYDFKTGKRFPGGTNHISFYKDEDYPVFAKGGAIIPLANPTFINDTRAPQELEINVFPGRSNTYRLYEDDGISTLYKKGYYLITSIDYNYRENDYTLVIRAVEGKSNIVPNTRNYKIRFRNTRQADDLVVHFNDKRIGVTSYIDGSDFIVEAKNIPTIGQLTINCKGKDIEISALRIVNEEIDSIISDLMIETVLKEEIARILFDKELTIKKKRIAIRKLKRKGLEPLFIKMFLKLLEYIEQI